MTQRVTLPNIDGEWELARHERIDDVYLACTFRKVDCVPRPSDSGTQRSPEPQRGEDYRPPKEKESERLWNRWASHTGCKLGSTEGLASRWFADYILARVREELPEMMREMGK